MSTGGDWQPVQTQQSAPNDDWGAVPSHAQQTHDDWGAQTVDGMAQTWAKQYGAEHVADVATPEIGAMVDRSANKYGLNPQEIRTLIGIETSGGRDVRTSSAGAQGIGQLLPSTFRSMGGKDINDPAQNIDATARYYAMLKKRFGGDALKAAMAYNMGPNGLQSALAQGYGAIPEETRRYAARFYTAMQNPPQRPAEARAPETKAAITGKHPQMAEAGVGEGAVQLARAAVGEHGVLDNAVRGAKNELFEGAQNAIGAVDAVFGAPQRFVEGAMHGAEQGHNPIETAKEGFGVAFHPHDQALQDRELDNVIDTLHLPHVQGNDMKSRILRLVEDFGAQTVTDPLTYVPLLGEVKMGVKGVEALDKVYEAAKAAGVSLPNVKQFAEAGRTMTKGQFMQGVRQLMNYVDQTFGRRPELNKYLDDGGKAARLSIEQAHRSHEATQAAKDATLLAEHEDELRNLKAGQPLPEAIRQRYLQEPWRNGTPEMRAEAERLGYKPTAEDLHDFAKPTGALHYNVREDYQTMVRPPKGATYEDMPIWRDVGGKHKEEFSGFEKSRRNEGALPEDQFELTKNRLAIGRARVRQVMTDADTDAYLNKYGGWKGNGPIDVSQLSHTPKRFAPDSPLRFATRIQKTAIAFNPLPHGLKNVGMLAHLAGGPEAFGKGLAYASKGLDDTQRSRLVNMGLEAEYVRDIEGPLKTLAEKVPASKAAYDLSNKTLSRLEMGYRQALLDQLDRKLGPSELPNGAIDWAKEYQKADIIRKALGDYRNNSAFVAALDALGGPFVAFRMGIVPGAVSRAMLRRPQNVEQVARGQQDFNDTVMHGSPSELDLGGPVEDYARMMTNLPAYLSSPSSLGPVLGLGAQWLTPDRPLTGSDVRDELGRTFVPGYSEAQSLGIPQALLGGGGFGAPPGVSGPASGLAAALGAYFRKRPSGKAARHYRRAEQRSQ